MLSCHEINSFPNNKLFFISNKTLIDVRELNGKSFFVVEAQMANRFY